MVLWVGLAEYPGFKLFMAWRVVVCGHRIALRWLLFGRLFYVFDACTFTSSYRRNPFINGYPVSMVSGSAVFSLATLHLPIGHGVLSTVPLEAKYLLKMKTISVLRYFSGHWVKVTFNDRWL